MSQLAPAQSATSAQMHQPMTTTNRQRLEHKTATALSQASYQFFTVEETASRRAHHYKVIIESLPRHSDPMLYRLLDASPELHAGLRHLLVMTEPEEAYINDWLTVEPIALQETMDSDPVIRGLHRYENLAPQEYGPRRIEQVRAIARATARFFGLGHGIGHDVDDQGFNIHYIEDVKLRNLLTTHENPGAVADLIIHRDITDARQITNLLETMDVTAKAIHDGAL